MSLAYGGKNCVTWSVSAVTGDSYRTGVSAHLLAWILSPLCTGCISGLLFRAVRSAVLQRSKPLLAMRYCYPLLIALTLLVNTVCILCKVSDVRGLSDKRYSTVVWIAAVSTLLISSVAATVGYPALQRFHMCAKSSSSSSSNGAANTNLNRTFRGRLTLKSNIATTVVHVGSCRIVPQENSTSCEETSAESTEFDDAFEHKTTVTAAAAALAQFGTTRRRHSGDLNSTKTSTLSKSGTLKRKEKNVLFSKRRTLWLLRTLRRTFLYVQSELNRKPEQMLSVSQYALTVHDTVELFDAATEDMFKHLQVTVTDR
eukprot:7899-Heterococcus_DN1.PRE.4